MITGFNHLTLTVSNLKNSLEFYQHLLGFDLKVTWDKGAYLTANDFWLCLNLGDPQPAQCYTHYAFSVSQADLTEFRKRLLEHPLPSWQDNHSEGDSLYLLDPDGHRLELHVGNLESRLKSLVQKPYSGLVWHSE